MIQLPRQIAIAFVSVFLAASAFATAEVDKPAPAFMGKTSSGETIALGDLKGKTVVLEWTNDGCPYVKKHYNTNNMQTLQKEAAADGVVWLTVISSAPGKQGHLTGAEADALTKTRGAVPAHIVLDPDGAVGKAYEAKTTPHMYVIDGRGILRFAGGIDDRATTGESSVQGATNYVRAALADVKAGKPVAVATPEPYGCSIKYGS